MTAKIVNAQGMKRINATIVLNTIRRTGTISRNELSRRIGLTPATITNLVSELIEAGYVVEVRKTILESSGRRPIMLAVNPEACYIVGVELSASRVVGILTDFKANILARETHRIVPTEKTDVIVDVIVGVIESVIAGSGVERARIRKVGLVTPGPYDSENGVMIAPPNLPNMRNVPIRSIIQERVGLPVLFEHHVQAAGFCEYWLGDAIESRCLLLCAVLEIGVAASILIDGRMLHGFHNGSGEIGHMMVDSNGPKCGCGNYGCLESLAEGRALVNAVKRRLKADHNLRMECEVGDVDRIDLDYVLNAAEQGREPFRAELLASARYVGMAIWNIIKVISPDTIILAGELPNRSKLFVEEIRRFLYGKVFYSPKDREIKISNTRFQEDIFPLGAVALAMEDISQHIFV